MSARLSDNRPVPRRGLSRDEAAVYVGIGATLFDRLVSDGRMPKPFRIDNRVLWDIRKIDLRIDELSRDDDAAKSSWEDA
jgi:predicted DNA-binding transcriptional regulator AlpA